MNSYMLCEANLMLVSFAASVALERFLPRVPPHVALQLTSRSASEVALVTLERLYSSVTPHYVPFQMTSCNAGKIACCASVRLFSSVVPHHVNFQLTICNAGKLTHCASARLLPRVGPFVLLQIA